ncbi:MAG TPA: PrsW family intramembrane metalloprotease [Pyrinomonadaceae bacterium]|nr:PrsW family intramembrane metalloprotease [Pyrinomonadaceae bacterium]
MYPNAPTPNPAGGSYPYQGATVAYRQPKRRSAIKIVFAIFAALVAALLGAIVLLLIGAETGMAALIVAMVAATLPVPVYIMLILWIDRYEAEPLWMLALTFFWGATVAVFAAYFLNTFTAIGVYIATESEIAARLLGAVIIAPFFEELAKGFILFVLFFWKKDEFDGVVDGFVYASMVGLGFAMTENFQYYGRVISQGGLMSTDFQEIYLVRGGLAAYSHPLFTSMTGIGLGVARQVKNGFVKFIMPLIGLGLAMFLHFLWNFSASLAGSLSGFLAIYAVLMVPIFLITLGIVFFALLREGRVVREYLLPDLQRGFFTQDEYNRLITIRGRMGSSLRAFRSGGVGIWRARMQYNQAASELAFHRSRVARGVVRMDHEMAAREQAIVQLLMELRQRMGQH